MLGLRRKMKTYKLICGILLSLFCWQLAHAVCLDPKTLISGYKVPLNDQIVSRESIIVGKVIKKLDLHEEKSDPQDITATLYTIRVKQILKGVIIKTIKIRSENDSGRYIMDVGEEHLLFLTKEDRYFRVDSCGNSSILPKGNKTLQMVKQYLKRP
jgi:hypothetical protein